MMGGWDYYCFLCAAGFHVPFELEGDDNTVDSDEDDFGDEYQGSPRPIHPKVLFPKESVFHRLQWLTKFRTIGQNRHASELTNCYITGPAVSADYGEAFVQLGDHPNAENLEEDLIHCYRNGEEETGDLPVHDNCFTILCQVFAKAQGIDYHWTPDQSSTFFPFELDSLFSCLASARRECRAHLDLDHGFEPEQYFDLEWKRIFDYFDPLEIIEMPPFRADKSDPDITEAVIGPSSGGILDTLPHELLEHILDYVPPSDLISSMKASSTIRRATKPDKFWQRRLRLDIPWLWEYREGEVTLTRNWQTFYSNVMMQAYKPMQNAGKGTHVSGLANRRRIWHVCEQVLKLYLESNSRDEPQQTTSIFEEGVVCRYLPMVASRQVPQFKSEAAFFFSTEEEMALEKYLKFKWNTEDALCGISMSTKAGHVSFGHVDDSQARESVMVIQPNDWIEKLVLNISVVFETITRTQCGEKRDHRLAVTGLAIWKLQGGVTTLGRDVGHKRLLEPLPENGIVGLKCQYSQGVITHLGLLEHDAGLTNLRSENDPSRLDLLWNNGLPPAELRFQDDSTGYWSDSTRRDLIPKHTLLFGSTDLQQSTMTGIGASADLVCLEIYRSDGSCEQVGRSQAPIKVFPLDGPGGERIAGFEWTIEHLPVGLTTITTHARQAVFGRRNDNARHGHTSQHGYGVAGLYCSFSYNNTGKDLMSSIGLIQSQLIERPPMNDDRLLDGTGLLWEPQPPSPSWHAIGEVYGPGNQGEVAMCLDFSRPVAKIEGLFPAPEWLAVIEIGGFVIHYGDGNLQDPLSHLGFPPQQWPTAADATPEAFRAMKRYPEMSWSSTLDLDTGEAHVLTDEDALAQPTTWDLGEPGERIVAATVWAGVYLHGIQFRSSSGKESSRWGRCGGKPTATIRAGGEECIVGLKFILGTRRLGYSARTSSPQAVQAMSDASQ